MVMKDATRRRGQKRQLGGKVACFRSNQSLFKCTVILPMVMAHACMYPISSLLHLVKTCTVTGR